MFFNIYIGVTIEPKMPSDVEQNSDIKYSIGGKTYDKYTQQLDEFLKRKYIKFHDVEYYYSKLRTQ